AGLVEGHGAGVGREAEDDGRVTEAGHGALRSGGAHLTRRGGHRRDHSENGGSSRMSAVSSSTSARPPITSGVRSCRLFGWRSRVGSRPLAAAPPARSAMYASGIPSYRRRSFPDGLLAVAG